MSEAALPVLYARWLNEVVGGSIAVETKATCNSCVMLPCKHVRRAVGFRFWRIADKLLREVEQELSLWCLAELKAGSAEVESDLANSPHVSELGGNIDWQQYRRLWAEWAGY